MSDLLKATAAEQSEALARGEVSSRELTQAHLDRIAAVDGAVGAFLDVDAEAALSAADAADAARAAGEDCGELAGVPVAVKDLIVTRGQVTTAASRMLEGWVPPYDATLVTQLRGAQMPIVGKTNLDEFAMGGSTEHSAFKRTANPWDLERIPGGSSGGSAAAVAAFEAPLAVGTDTGGSIRQPAAMTGTVGVKPTYGTVSRYGVIAMASSLDTPGPMARTVLDTALLHDVIACYDPCDSTSLKDVPRGMADVVRAAQQGRDLSGLRVGVIEELDGVGEGYEPGVVDSFRSALELLEQAGAQVTPVSLPHLEYALDAYYLIMPAEASSNLARYDGMRYGLRVEPSEGPVTAETVMAATRGAGFGDEVKRRIILGTHVLSAGYYDAYYGSAQKVRTLVQRDFEKAWSQVDVLVSPTSPMTAYRFGEKDDPLAMYKLDVTTIPANLAGIPGMSLPCGLSQGLPVGFQILAPQRADDRLYRTGAVLEAALTDRWGGPLLAQAPALEEK